MGIEAFADRLSALLPVFLREVMKRERNYFARGKITVPQLHVLQRIAETGQCPMTEIAKALGVRPSTATGLADHLVKIGLIRRFTTPKDRRVVLVAMTSKGDRILRDIFKEKRKTIVSAFGTLTAAERTAYLDILRKIVNGFIGGSGGSSA